MKTKYKFIYFEQIEKSSWVCKNTKANNILGQIEWYPKWKQYVFTQFDEGIIFSIGCLEDIIDFMKQL